ncbi:hypothetical protein ACWEIM_12945 [Streptomyces sp. NPDC004778]
MKPLKRPVRRGSLVAHVAVSVSWLGLTVGPLALGITACTTGGPATVGAATYLFIAAISILKPWGLTRRGRRLRFSASSAKSVDARSPCQTA